MNLITSFEILEILAAEFRYRSCTTLNAFSYKEFYARLGYSFHSRKYVFDSQCLHLVTENHSFDFL